MGLLGMLLGALLKIPQMGGGLGAGGGLGSLMKAPPLNAMNAGGLLGGGSGLGIGKPGMSLPTPAAGMRGPMSGMGPSAGMTPGGFARGPIAGPGPSGGFTPGMMQKPAMPIGGQLSEASKMLGTQPQGVGMHIRQMPMPTQPSMSGQMTKPSVGMNPPMQSPQAGGMPQMGKQFIQQGMQQSQPAFTSLAKSVNPLSSANAGGLRETAGNVGGSSKYQLGSLSEKYEAGGRGVAAMNPEAHGIKSGDRGGPSYGPYQLAANPGTLQKYINQSQYANNFKGLKPGTPEFNKEWMNLAQNDPNFGPSQHDFIQKTHYAPVRAYADKLGIPNTPALNNALWSTGVQHGPGGARSILDRAGIKPGMSESQILNNIYSGRSRAYPAGTPRYKAELSNAIAMSKGIYNPLHASATAIIQNTGQSISKGVETLKTKSGNWLTQLHEKITGQHPTTSNTSQQSKAPMVGIPDVQPASPPHVQEMPKSKLKQVSAKDLLDQFLG